MGLEYPKKWRFKSSGIEMPNQAARDFQKLINQIAKQVSDGQRVFELFKTAFGDHSKSSNTSFAYDDMFVAMRRSANDAVAFLDSLCNGCESVSSRLSIEVPEDEDINSILNDHEVPLNVSEGCIVEVVTDADFLESDDKSGEEKDRPRYALGSEIGRGGFGVVYEVSRVTSVAKFDLAMKVLDPSAFNSNREKARARFENEIKSVAKLQHRGIIQYVDAGFTNEQKPYVVMPLIRGKQLFDALSGASALDLVRTFREILLAVQYAHSLKIIHRDLRPANILVRKSDGQPIILDFGCAYSLDFADEKTLTSEGIGSVRYMPPEVIADPKKRTKLHDIYSCGRLMYEAVTRDVPDLDDYKPLAEYGDDFAMIDPIVRGAIEHHSKRIPDARKFVSLLDQAAAGLG